MLLQRALSNYLAQSTCCRSDLVLRSVQEVQSVGSLPLLR